jgi:hypothetical protein
MLKQIGILAVLLSGCAAQGENDFDDNVITHRWDDNIGGQTSVQSTGGNSFGGSYGRQTTNGYVAQPTGGRTQTTTTSVSTGGLQGTGGKTSNAGIGGTNELLDISNLHMYEGIQPGNEPSKFVIDLSTCIIYPTAGICIRCGYPFQWSNQDVVICDKVSYGSSATMKSISYRNHSICD